MCGKKPPTQATVDPAVERQKAADDAARKANKQLVMENRRRRGQQGLLSADTTGQASVLRKASEPGIGNMFEYLAESGNQSLLGRAVRNGIKQV